MENKDVISLEEFKLILWCLEANEEAYDVELYYKVYIALKTGSDKDLLKAKANLAANQHMGDLGRLN